MTDFTSGQTVWLATHPSAVQRGVFTQRAEFLREAGTDRLAFVHVCMKDGSGTGMRLCVGRVDVHTSEKEALESASKQRKQEAADLIAWCTAAERRLDEINNVPKNKP